MDFQQIISLRLLRKTNRPSHKATLKVDLKRAKFIQSLTVRQVFQIKFKIKAQQVFKSFMESASIKLFD